MDNQNETSYKNFGKPTAHRALSSMPPLVVAGLAEALARSSETFRPVVVDSETAAVLAMLRLLGYREPWQ